MTERFHRQMKRLFQRELARKRRMHRLIGEAHPGRARRKGKLNLGSFLLIGGIELRAIMQAKHQVVVSTAPSARYAERLEYPRLQRQRLARARREFARHVLE